MTDFTLSQIPTSATLPYYSFQTTLSGSLYTLEMRLNTRMNRWFLNILDTTMTPIVLGIPLEVSRNVLAPYRTLAVPPGALFVIDTTGANLSPGITSFLSTHVLLYADFSP